MQVVFGILCVGCWTLFFLSARYALGNGSGHSSFDFSLLGLASLFIIGFAMMTAILRKWTMNRHLVVSAVVLCIASFYIRYSNLIVPYDIWVKGMEIGYVPPTAPEYFLMCVGLTGIFIHAFLFSKVSPET